MSINRPTYPLGANPAHALARAPAVGGALVVLAHIPLALLIEQSSLAATLHAVATLALGLWWALSGKHPERVAMVGAYIAGAEVLWRMGEARIFWESGKYGLVAIFALALLRRRQASIPPLPLLYLLMLLPSALITLGALPAQEAYQQLSFNLSGPAALFASVWFFSHLSLSAGQLRRLFVALIAPALGIAAIALSTMLRAPVLAFSGDSNLLASGGFGPNQVSAILGLGALLAFLTLLNGGGGPTSRLSMFVVMSFLIAQSALTFSRGGVYNMAGSALLAGLCILREPRSRLRLFVTLVAFLALLQFALLPRLDSFTGGALSARLSDANLSGRDRIIQADLQIWQEHPLLGVGPGLSPLQHARFNISGIAHTEFARLLAEHGLLGLIATGLFAAMAIRSVARAQTSRHRAVAIALVAWCALFMLSAAMRLAAPAFVFGLAAVTLSFENDGASTHER